MADETASGVRVRRAYDPPEAADGHRVLVDRLWPRGLSKEHAHFDEWLRTVAPSAELRRWYGHDPARFGEFAARYRAELAEAEHAEALGRLRALAVGGPLTLLTATKDLEHAHTHVLAEELKG
ncbi:DUF488 domain-containing protein [Streptomyces sp. SPB074]|uniref:DUF488 domain-containing protein n=1 Tax=Streptomyces sp. (strain SPB074) TaxID=465543 RepID=UPI00017F246C|nr:DUF488 family protein [Streptomyces sp. SPB074]EDY45643.1 uroporphyrin-III c-methyltransferase [Streptomyces sp. SPB074]